MSLPQHGDCASFCPPPLDLLLQLAALQSHSLDTVKGKSLADTEQSLREVLTMLKTGTSCTNSHPSHINFLLDL